MSAAIFTGGSYLTLFGRRGKIPIPYESNSSGIDCYENLRLEDLSAKLEAVVEKNLEKNLASLLIGANIEHEIEAEEKAIAELEDKEEQLDIEINRLSRERENNGIVLSARRGCLRILLGETETETETNVDVDFVERAKGVEQDHD